MNKAQHSRGQQQSIHGKGIEEHDQWDYKGLLNLQCCWCQRNIYKIHSIPPLHNNNISTVKCTYWKFNLVETVIVILANIQNMIQLILLLSRQPSKNVLILLWLPARKIFSAQNLGFLSTSWGYNTRHVSRRKLYIATIVSWFFH